MRKIFLSNLIYTLVIGAIFGISVILLGVWNELTWKILAITGTIFGFSIPGVICSSLYDKKKYETVACVGMFTCFIACLFFIFNILTIFETFGDSYEYVIKVSLILVLLSWSLGHISELLLENINDSTILNVRNLTIVLSVGIDALWIFRLLVENDDFMRIDAVLAILIALGTIVVPIANKIVTKNTNNNEEDKVEETPVEVKVEKVEPSDRLFEIHEEAKVEVKDIPRTTNPDNNILGEIKDNKSSNDDKYDKLEKLKKLLDLEAITQEEYDSEKKKILEEK
ncbi:MAG: hypothetical protein K6E99_02115 [Bacilli bacterium]|nr:hypothetical protein [Bacilli bacterium]